LSIDIDLSVQNTKYMHIKSTIVYSMFHRRNWDSPLLSRKRVSPSPRTNGGGGREHSPACEGVGASQFRRLEKSLALCLLRGSEQQQKMGRFSLYQCSVGCGCCRIWFPVCVLLERVQIHPHAPAEQHRILEISTTICFLY
jgi:hypothetical protein